MLLRTGASTPLAKLLVLRRRIIEPRARRARSCVLIVDIGDRRQAGRNRVGEVLVRVEEVYLEVGAGWRRYVSRCNGAPCLLPDCS